MNEGWDSHHLQGGLAVSDRVLLAVPLGDGSGDVVEVEVARSDVAELEESGVVLAADSGGGRMRAVGFSFVSGVEHVLPALSAVVSRLKTDSAGFDAPDEITVSVGLQVGGEAGIYFAKGTSEATIEVAMTWRKPQ